jgi:hypothetical protein
MVLNPNKEPISEWAQGASSVVIRHVLIGHKNVAT